MFQQNADEFKTVAEVAQALRKAGLETSNLVIGIDYTKYASRTIKLYDEESSIVTSVCKMVIDPLILIKLEVINGQERSHLVVVIYTPLEKIFKILTRYSYLKFDLLSLQLFYECITF